MKISVVIVTYNRWDDLKISLPAYLSQTYKNIEIIVIDNASQDGTRENLPKEFPTIKYVWLPDNFEIRAINIGVDMACGDIIWRCDDDSYPLHNDCFEKMMDIFKKHDDIHIIAAEIVIYIENNKIWEWYPFKVDKENIAEKGYVSCNFSGAGAAIRKKVFEEIGGFWGFGYEEIDFSSRAILAGFNIRYFPNLIIVHLASRSGRASTWRWVTIARQMMRYNWKYFPFINAVGRSIALGMIEIFTAIYTRRNILVIIEGINAMFSGALYSINNDRQVVSKQQLKEITLGVNICKNIYLYLKSIIKGKIIRFKNKK